MVQTARRVWLCDRVSQNDRPTRQGSALSGATRLESRFLQRFMMLSRIPEKNLPMPLFFVAGAGSPTVLLTALPAPAATGTGSTSPAAGAAASIGVLPAFVASSDRVARSSDVDSSAATADAAALSLPVRLLVLVEASRSVPTLPVIDVDAGVGDSEETDTVPELELNPSMPEQPWPVLLLFPLLFDDDDEPGRRNRETNEVDTDVDPGVASDSPLLLDVAAVASLLPDGLSES